MILGQIKPEINLAKDVLLNKLSETILTFQNINTHLPLAFMDEVRDNDVMY